MLCWKLGINRFTNYVQDIRKLHGYLVLVATPNTHPYLHAIRRWYTLVAVVFIHSVNLKLVVFVALWSCFLMLFLMYTSNNNSNNNIWCTTGIVRAWKVFKNNVFFSILLKSQDQSGSVGNFWRNIRQVLKNSWKMKLPF